VRLSTGRRADRYAHVAVSGEKILSCGTLGYSRYFTCLGGCTFLEAEEGLAGGPMWQ
jgi:hypothetical protein